MPIYLKVHLVRLARHALLASAVLAATIPLQAAGPGAMPLYQQLRAFPIGAEAVHADHYAMKRDRVSLEWTGDFYLSPPINGKVYGAVFLGKGHITVEASTSFEKDSLRRFLQADKLDTDFTSAVLRFSDDTADLLSKLSKTTGTNQPNAQKLALECDRNLLADSGFNVSERLTESIVSAEVPGIFLAEFMGSQYGRFGVLLDHQMRSIGGVFEINGGEKGIVFQGNDQYKTVDIWTAFYDEEDYRNGRVFYASHFDLVQIPEYRMDLDLRDPGHWVRGKMELDVVALQDGVQFIPFMLNEGLSEHDKDRRKKGTRITAAALSDGSTINVIQEPEQVGMSLVLPRALARGEKATLVLNTEAEHSLWDWKYDFHYPLSTESWFPRHGYLLRSRFKMKFEHKQNVSVISGGTRTSDGAQEAGKEAVTEWDTGEPVPFDAFVLGPFERHNDKVKAGGKEIPIEFDSASARYLPIKEDFVIAELGNSLKFFTKMFGDYPYSRLGAAYFPTNFGQGFPTLLLLPATGNSGMHDLAFLSHEVSHQWWGDEVTWQSYRDQWLSEGFAEYSAALYTSSRDNAKHALDLVREMRLSLQGAPKTDLGSGSGKLYEIGPLIMGSRLNSRVTLGGYNTLVYNRGALTLRMLHFLLTDPSTGNDDAFYAMMKEFVQTNAGKAASTEKFFALASKHFAQTDLAKKYGLTNLNWFVQQWVYDWKIPTYRLEYDVQPRAEGGSLLVATLHQEGVPDQWFMPLPLVIDLDGGKQVRPVVMAHGPETQIKLGLPGNPSHVALDPDLWILTVKTAESRVKH